MNEVNKTDIYKLPQKLRQTHVNNKNFQLNWRRVEGWGIY